MTLTSPEGTHQVDIYLDANGRPGYRVFRSGNPVIDSSGLGFAFRDQPALMNGMQWMESSSSAGDETWEMPWGEQRTVRNRYNAARIVLEEQEAPGRKLILHFRAYEDGVAFRYELPEQADTDTLFITEELTDRALEFMNQSSGKPFCLYLSHKAVHHPWLPPPDCGRTIPFPSSSPRSTLPG